MGQALRSPVLVLAATLLVGIGYLAILPPFEGFDETAHYSSVRQIADTKTLPLFGRSFIDKSVRDYEKNGPMPWSSGKPPFEQPGHLTYPAFFANPAAVTHYAIYRSGPVDKFTPSSSENWEAQHPPLYYLLMAPIMRATAGFSFVSQIFILRLASYLLAWVGFVIGWWATQRYEGKAIPRGVATGYLYFPFAVPMFFSEFARIGNDSLCLFLLGLIFSLSLAVFYRDDRSIVRPFTLGVFLGLGLLTKAFFLPIVVAYATFMTLRAWQARQVREVFRRRLLVSGLAILPALLVGGAWYVHDFVAYGSPTGSNDAIVLEQHGGLGANLLRNFSVYTLIHDVIGIAVSWSWAGSWSLAHVSPVLQVPLLLISCWIAANYFLSAKSYNLGNPIWLPVWLFALIVGGLFYHELVIIAEGISGTPGWYLNILAPFLALAMGYGVERISRSAARLLLVPALAYTMSFLLVVLWSQMALFAGCAVKNDDKLYQFPSDWLCLDRVSEVTTHLTVFGWPLLAVLSIGSGFLCLLIGSFALAISNRFRLSPEAILEQVPQRL